MTHRTRILCAAALLLIVPSSVGAAEKSTHNPTGSDEVENGWRSGGCGSRSGCGDAAGNNNNGVDRSSNTETTDSFGKIYQEQQLQGDKPKVTRPW